MADTPKPGTFSLADAVQPLKIPSLAERVAQPAVKIPTVQAGAVAEMLKQQNRLTELAQGPPLAKPSAVQQAIDSAQRLTNLGAAGFEARVAQSVAAGRPSPEFLESIQLALDADFPHGSGVLGSETPAERRLREETDTLRDELADAYEKQQEAEHGREDAEARARDAEAKVSEDSPAALVRFQERQTNERHAEELATRKTIALAEAWVKYEISNSDHAHEAAVAQKEREHRDAMADKDHTHKEAIAAKDRAHATALSDAQDDTKKRIAIYGIVAGVLASAVTGIGGYFVGKGAAPSATLPTTTYSPVPSPPADASVDAK